MQTPATPTPKTKKRRRSARSLKPTVTCQLCGQAFKAIHPNHLLTHGYTAEQYVRVFAAPLAPPISAHTPHTSGQGHPGGRAAMELARRDVTPRVPADITSTVAQQLLGNPDFVAALATDVQATILGGPIRDHLRLALASVLTTRMELHGKAAANLIAVREELSQSWRVDAGGHDGDPTPTLHLVAMAGEAHAEVSKTEEALLRTIKLAIEETRVKDHSTTSLSGRPAFSGDAERIPVPPELPAAEREVVRTLFGLLRQEVEARATRARTPITIQTSAPPHASPSPTPPLPPTDTALLEF